MSRLMDAHKQWAHRPADERFWTLDEMLDACQHYKDTAVDADVSGITLGADSQDIWMEHSGQQAKLSNWAFEQLAARVKAPAGYLQTLPAPIAAIALQHGLSERNASGKSDKVLIHQNGGCIARAFLSDDYSRIWNADVLRYIQDRTQDGWQVPPAMPSGHYGQRTRKATEDDVLRCRANGWGIQVGDTIAPAGLYASDHDMFVFMVNESVRIEDGSPEGLGRGFFVYNSEVGGGAFKLTAFMYRFVCGNHIVWGAQHVNEMRIVHRGRANQRFGSQLRAELRQYAHLTSAADQQRILTAKNTILGASRVETIETLFDKIKAPRKVLEDAYDAAEAFDGDYANPRSVWGMAQGVTRVSQRTPFADKRMELDRTASRILDITASSNSKPARSAVVIDVTPEPASTSMSVEDVLALLG